MFLESRNSLTGCSSNDIFFITRHHLLKEKNTKIEHKILLKFSSEAIWLITQNSCLKSLVTLTKYPYLKEIPDIITNQASKTVLTFGILPYIWYPY